MALALTRCIELDLNDSELSCPFTWGIQKCLQYQSCAKDRNLNDYDFQDIPLMSFIIRLVYTTECVLVKKDMDPTTTILKDCEMMLQELRSKFQDIIRGLEHIFYATKYHFLLRTEDADEAQNIRKKIVAMSDLNNVEHGAIFGCKSYAYIMYQSYFIEDAIECAKRAIECNPTNALWYFNMAQALRKKRRINTYQSSASELEFHYFKRACEMSDCIYYKLYYLQCQQERWGINYPNDWQAKRTIMLNRLVAYEQMLRAAENNTLIMLKIVLALMRISKASKHFGDYHVAKAHSALALQILDRVDTIARSSTSIHYRGILFKAVRDYTNATKCFKEAADLGNAPAIFSYTQMLMYKHEFDNIISYLLSHVEQHKGTSHEQVILLRIGIGYFVKGDIRTAVEYIVRAIERNPESERLSALYMFGWFKEKSMYDFVANTLLPHLKKRITDTNFRRNLENLKKLYDSHIEQLRYAKLLKLSHTI